MEKSFDKFGPFCGCIFIVSIRVVAFHVVCKNEEVNGMKAVTCEWFIIC